MLSTRIIPCLDVHNGRTVKGINFLNLQDAGDPVEQAKLYSEVGADEICFLDISATNEQRKAMFDVISKTAETSLVPLTVLPLWTSMHGIVLVESFIMSLSCDF